MFIHDLYGDDQLKVHLNGKHGRSFKVSEVEQACNLSLFLQLLNNVLHINNRNTSCGIQWTKTRKLNIIDDDLCLMTHRRTICKRREV